jgi:uncharacterized RDD family membrane protein YckC
MSRANVMPYAAPSGPVDPVLRVGFLPRVGAALLDLVFLLPFLAATFGPLAYLDAKGKLTPFTEQVIMAVVSLGVLAYASFEIFKAATPGKMVLGQRIVGADASPASTEKLVSRFLTKHIPEMIGLVASITGLTLLDRLETLASVGFCLASLAVLGAARQAVWDRLAGTVVMRTKDLQEIPGFHPLMSSPAHSISPPSPDWPPNQQG